MRRSISTWHPLPSSSGLSPCFAVSLMMSSTTGPCADWREADFGNPMGINLCRYAALQHTRRGQAVSSESYTKRCVLAAASSHYLPPLCFRFCLWPSTDSDNGNSVGGHQTAARSPDEQVHATTRWPTPPDSDCATIRLVDTAAHRDASVPGFVSFVSGRHGPSTSHHRTRLRHAICHAAPTPLAPVTTQYRIRYPSGSWCFGLSWRRLRCPPVCIDYRIDYVCSAGI